MPSMPRSAAFDESQACFSGGSRRRSFQDRHLDHDHAVGDRFSRGAVRPVSVVRIDDEEFASVDGDVRAFALELDDVLDGIVFGHRSQGVGGRPGDDRRAGDDILQIDEVPVRFESDLIEGLRHGLGGDLGVHASRKLVPAGSQPGVSKCQILNDYEVIK